MKTTPSFTPSLFRSFKSKLNVDTWDKVMETYEQGKHREAFLLLLDYIDDNIRKKYGKDDCSFEIPHGSVMVKIELTENEVKVSAPFLKTTKKTKLIPLYRHIAELNFGSIGLPQIILKKSEFHFVYQCAINLCEPSKMYEVFQDICLNADQYDEEFIAKFDAEGIQTPELKHYDDSLLDKAYDEIQVLLTESLELINYLEEKRFTAYLWDVINITLKRIDFYIFPQGRLRNEIEKNIRILYSNESPESKIQKGKQFLTELKEKKKEEMIEDFYMVNIFVSPKYRANIDSLGQRWTGPYKNAQKEIGDGYSMGGCFTLLVALYDVFFYSNIDDEISSKIIQLLQNTANTPWDKAAPKLLNGIDRIMKGQSVEGEGFLKRLFG